MDTVHDIKNVAWQPVTADSAPTLGAILAAQSLPLSDYSITNLVMWGRPFRTNWAHLDETIIIRGVDPITDQPFILMPLGATQVETVSRLAIDTARLAEAVTLAMGERKTLIVRALDESYAEAFIHAMTGARFTIVADRNERADAEYLYRTEQFAEYPGHTLRRKRELCSYFNRQWPTHSFTRYDPGERGDRDDVRAFLKKWYEEAAARGSGDDPYLTWEEAGAADVLRDIDQLPCQGYVLRAAGEVAAFLLAEELTEEILLILYEKGSRAHKGSYDTIKRELARSLKDTYPWMSLEEDMGVPGLRRAKELYRPNAMIAKRSVTLDLSASGGSDG